MKQVSYCLLAISLAITTVHAEQISPKNEGRALFINKLGLNLGMNFPFGAGALREGAYPWGLSLYLTGDHTTASAHDYELVAGAEIMADYGGGIYFALPVLVNRTHELANFGNDCFAIDGFAGLGYSFHHVFSRTEGIVVKNQHTLGIDMGLISKVAIGRKWSFNVRMGVFRSFTKPVQAYFAGKAVTSETEFKYATFPILIGFSRKIGRLAPAKR